MTEDKADIFISYAHLDNAPQMEDKEGWVTKFHKYLEPRLKTILGKKTLKIWRDIELRKNELFGEEIYKQLSDNVLLICIFSPSYLGSDWCGREVEFFEKANNYGKSIAPTVGRKSRIFKVDKMEVDKNDNRITKLPKILRESLGYRFFSEKGVELEYEEEKKAYRDQLIDLAKDIAKLLNDSSKNESNKEKDIQSVFVAETPDCADERDIVKRELEDQGFQVVPDSIMNYQEEPLYITEMEELINGSAFCIQLLGEEYGSRHSASGKSNVHLQHEIMSAVFRKSNKKLFFWIKKGNRSSNMTNFLDKFYESVDSIPMDEDENQLIIMDGQSIDKLNLEIADYIKSLQKIQKTNIDGTASNKMSNEAPKLLLIINELDKESKNFVPLYQHINRLGVEVMLNTFSEDKTRVNEILKKQVERSSAVMYYYGAGDELWLDEQKELVEELAQQSGKTLNQAIYIDEPETFEKEILISPIYHIVNGVDKKDVTKNNLLLEFLQLICNER